MNTMKINSAINNVCIKSICVKPRFSFFPTGIFFPEKMRVNKVKNNLAQSEYDIQRPKAIIKKMLLSVRSIKVWVL